MTETNGGVTNNKDLLWVEKVVRQIQRGEEAGEGFKLLFDAYAERIERYFRRRGVDAQMTEDLAQDVMLRVYKGIGRFRWRSSFNTWIYIVMDSVYKNHLRSRGTLKAKAESDSLDSLLDDLAAGEIVRPPEGLEDEHPDPEAVAVSEEQKRRVAAAVEAMPPKMRQCFLLRFQGLAYREIARMLGVKPDTVKKHLDEARTRLRPLFTTLAVLMAILGWVTRLLESSW